jgi:hypothetical protein
MWNRVVNVFILYSQFYYGPHQRTEREMRKACYILIGKPEGTIDIWRPVCRWQDAIKINPK